MKMQDLSMIVILILSQRANTIMCSASISDEFRRENVTLKWYWEIVLRREIIGLNNYEWIVKSVALGLGLPVVSPNWEGRMWESLRYYHARQ